MNLSTNDKKLLEDLCQSAGLDSIKIIKLLKVESDFEFRERRTGIYEILREIINSSNSKIEGD